MKVFDTKELRTLLQQRFGVITEGVNHLFEVNVDKEELWNIYLDSFPPGTNEIYRERRAYDCNTCKQFIKRIGNVVSIKNGEVLTVWDVETGSDKFQPVVDALANFIKTNVVLNVFSTKEKHAGTSQSRELSEGTVKVWDHLHIELPSKFVNNTSKSDAEIKGEFKSSKDVFKRSLDEISQESLLTILELIQQNSLYKGEEWKAVLTEFLKHKKVYDKLSSSLEKELYTWEQSVKNGSALTRIRNHSIGTLLVDVSNDEDLDVSVRKYEAIVAPHNYKRPKAIFTKKMLEDAQKTVQELGLMDSLKRRYATLDDITVNNVLFSNKDAASRVEGAEDVFAQLSASIPENPKKFSKVDEISIEDFIANVLPTATSVEAFVEKKHSSNFVSLIAPEVKDSKTMFKWDNNYSWAYANNLADSSMKENVKSAGGKVDGVLRFSIQWNDDGNHDQNDLDAHCYEPDGNHIYFRSKRNPYTTGQLDVDITSPSPGRPAVENITWTNINKMKEGTYKFLVHNYRNRGGRSGFRAEIEFNGEVYSFDVQREIRDREYVEVAEVTLKDGVFTIKELLPSNVSSKEVWGVQTNQFVPVTVIHYSPNYWNEQQGIGHKHYMFMLKDTVNPERPNSFFNEYLQEDLMKHKRVFEALGSKMAVQDVADQLSGLGFSSTKRNELLVKVTGQTERLLKVKF